MQKKIIALAIASAMAMPALAMAEATVYGQANVAIEMTDNGSDTPNTNVGNAADSRTQISSNVSRLGFKGSEELGGGMSAIWQMEGQVNLDDGTGVSKAGTSFFNRNTFAGLSGGFGTVVLGRHDTPYKMSTRKLDMFADTIADNRSIMGNGHDARLNNVLAYLSPDISGFNAAVALVLGTDNEFAGAPTTETSATSLSLKYGMGDTWSVILANQTIDSTDSVVPGNKYNSSATKLGGTFAMDMFSVGLVYEMLADKDGAGTKVEKSDIYIGGKVKVGDAGAVKLGYTMASEWKAGGQTAKNSEGSQVSLGYDHALGKNTTVYALYSSVSNGTANGTGCGPGCQVPSYGLNGGGSTGDTSAGPLVAGGVGNPSAVAIGIKHSF